MSLFWESYFTLQGTQLSRSSAYHPQSDGQTKNLNRILEQYLRCTVGEKPHSWVQALPWAEWWYNTSYHSAINMTLFRAFYGYNPPFINPYLPRSTDVASVDEQLQDRDELLKILKENLMRAQEKMKRFHARRHIERSFVVGDFVYLKLQPYKQHSVQRRMFHMLATKYYGPFEVTEKIGEVVYRLKLPTEAKIHNVFHVSLLKKKLGDTVTAEAQLPPIIDVDKKK
ncbi:hypothetical protein ACLB2K_040186 [Fragaria x ananassa]